MSGHEHEHEDGHAPEHAPGTGTGAGLRSRTYQNADGTRGPKYDHLFTDRSASASCCVTDVHVPASDHPPVYATTSFRAG